MITGIPYGYDLTEYQKDIKEKVDTWFDEVKDLVKSSHVLEVKTEVFMDVYSVVGSIVDFAKKKNMDL